IPPRKRGASQPPSCGTAKVPHRHARPTVTTVRTPIHGRRRSASAHATATVNQQDVAA
ncbi:hypothetical protein LSAT2_004658, partial [Lamellibrachia satsuma]